MTCPCHHLETFAIVDSFDAKLMTNYELELRQSMMNYRKAFLLDQIPRLQPVLCFCFENFKYCTKQIRERYLCIWYKFVRHANKRLPVWLCSRALYLFSERKVFFYSSIALVNRLVVVLNKEVDFFFHVQVKNVYIY